MKKLIEIAKEKGAQVIDEGDVIMCHINGVTITEAQLQATFDDYCKQFEPVLTNYGVTMQDRNFSASGDAIYDNNFDYDARLTVSGDFADGIKEEYAKMIVNVLNGYKKQIPSEVKEYIEKLEKALKFVKFISPRCVQGGQVFASAFQIVDEALASKPACLKD